MNQGLKGTTKFLLSVTDGEQILRWLEEHGGEQSVAMVGRSNVGKSTLINSLFGRKMARVSKEAGRTRAINVFEFQLGGGCQYLYDLPGYGHAKAPRAMQREWGELMESFFGALRPSTLIVNIRDARHPQEAADLAFQQFFESFDLPVFLVFNKLDKLSSQKERAAFGKTRDEVLEGFSRSRETFELSARTGQGAEKLERALINFFLGT